METTEVSLTSESKSFRQKTGKLLTSPFIVIEVIIISSFLMLWFGNAGYFFGIGVVILTLWSIKWDWSFVGLGDIKWGSSLRPAIGYTLMIILLNDFLFEPLVEIITKTPIDLSMFEGLRDNTTNYLVMLVVMWVFAAFGEELLYRGYLMKRLANLLGNKNNSWIIATFLSAIVFGVVHSYQGTSGMLTTGMVGLILGFAFYHNRNNLLIGMLVHGIYDTYGLTLIYLGKELVIKNMMIEIYQSLIK